MTAISNQGSDVPNSEGELTQLPNTHYLNSLDNRTLEERARRIGAALGRAVVALRKTGAKLKDTANQATGAAASQMVTAKQQIKTSYESTRSGARRLVNDYPVHVVLCAGAVGLVLGASLKIWRGKR